MMTLDETVKALTAFYEGLDIPEGEKPLLLCALNHLISYQRNIGILIYYQGQYLEELRKLRSNPALTWEELLEMEGKPVWVQYGVDKGVGDWITLYNTKVGDVVYGTTCAGVQFWIYKGQYGKAMLAFRREI